MSKLRKSAKGQRCTLRLQGCNHNPETTVLAHIRIAGRCGAGLKPADNEAVFACSHCHDVIDGRIKADFDYRDVLRGHFETVDIWRKMGLVNIPSIKNESEF